ncbi:MAG: DHHA1 domain-containing protein [Candidatus Eisenbacteria bacterium]
MKSTRELAPAILAGRKVLLTTHSGPDGDGLGCLAALGDSLEAHGYEVLRLLPEPLPSKYAFLDPKRQFKSITSDRALAEATTWDLALVLDTHQSSLTREVGEWIKGRGIPTLYLDHHPIDGGARDDVHGSCDAVATGVLVYELITRDLGWPLSPFAAEALYVSISFDTNSFKYVRSAPESLEVGAALIRQGVDTTRVYRHLFASNPLRKARLLGWVLSNVEFLAEGRIAYVLVSHARVDEMKLERDDLRDSVNHILEIDGVEIAATLKETEPHQVKISLRSKGRCVINGVASSFGGGGHALAAGCELEGDLTEIWQKLAPPLVAALTAGAPA